MKKSSVLGIITIISIIILMIAILQNTDRIKQEPKTLEEEFKEYKEEGGEGLIPYYEAKISGNNSEEKNLDVEKKSEESTTPPEKDTIEYVRETEDCLTIIDQKIYNITAWIEGEHKNQAISFCGSIATKAYKTKLRDGLIPKIPDRYYIGKVKGNYTLLS